ncbi:MAG: hypothetical protein WD942_04680 [Dehalococcoidia bacterium]
MRHILGLLGIALAALGTEHRPTPVSALIAPSPPHQTLLRHSHALGLRLAPYRSDAHNTIHRMEALGIRLRLVMVAEYGQCAALDACDAIWKTQIRFSSDQPPPLVYLGDISRVMFEAASWRLTTSEAPAHNIVENVATDQAATEAAASVSFRTGSRLATMPWATSTTPVPPTSIRQSPTA